MKNLALLAGGLLTLFFSSCKEIEESSTGVSLTLAEQRKAIVSNVGYHLQFNIPAGKDSAVSADGVIVFDLKDNSKTLFLDFKADKDAVKEVVVNGEKQKIRHTNEHIALDAADLLVGKNRVEIKFYAGSGALNRNPDYMYALFVPDRARTAFPCFDQPDIKASYTLALTIPENWKAMSNAPLSEIKGSDQKKTWQFFPSDTISTYLFSFTAGAYFEEKKSIDGREMVFYHRETDSLKLAASVDAIFDMHAQSIRYMEAYTDIPYPFKKFDFAAIPDFQFGGMEHPGAIWYNANTVFLDGSATKTQLLKRANLIAHETSHIWFGDLVTMTWFNDVWMKEVFANFMADKIVQLIMPDNNASLKFLMAHYPAAYSVDRTQGANPIRQPLENLQEAGSLYGGIIYHKAPIMMEQLERIAGEETLKKGLQVYLKKFSFSNASWPDLIEILDTEVSVDLKVWNDNWVNKAGRSSYNYPITDIQSNTYGLFTVDTTKIKSISSEQNSVLRAFTYLNLYENMLEGKYITPRDFIHQISIDLSREKDDLIVQMLLDQLNSTYWRFISAETRKGLAAGVEAAIWKGMENSATENLKRVFFKAFGQMALTDEATTLLFNIWQKKVTPGALNLKEDDYIEIAAALALRNFPNSESILKQQADSIQNADRKLRFNYLMAPLSNDTQTRDVFFETLKAADNRNKESWINTALLYLHHPLRQEHSEKYLLTSLELLEEIQQTGDIFFPQNWLHSTLGMYQSKSAAEKVRKFLSDRPGYNDRLRNKILQTADNLFRAQNLVETEGR